MLILQTMNHFSFVMMFCFELCSIVVLTVLVSKQPFWTERKEEMNRMRHTSFKTPLRTLVWNVHHEDRKYCNLKIFRTWTRSCFSTGVFTSRICISHTLTADDYGQTEKKCLNFQTESFHPLFPSHRSAENVFLKINVLFFHFNDPFCCYLHALFWNILCLLKCLCICAFFAAGIFYKTFSPICLYICVEKVIGILQRTNKRFKLEICLSDNRRNSCYKTTTSFSLKLSRNKSSFCRECFSKDDLFDGYNLHNFQSNILSKLCDRLTDYVSGRVYTLYPFTASLNSLLYRSQNDGQISEEDENCYEIHRFQSFVKTFIQASPMRLARSGFFATGSGDETRCFSCRVTHRNWQLMDNVDQVHRSLSPGCLHLNTGDPRNVPISSEPTSSGDRIAGISSIGITGLVENHTQTGDNPVGQGQGTTDLTASFLDSTTPSNATPLDITQAVYPQFKDLDSRRTSFQGWGHSHVQDPNILASAGFYYAGYRDCVRCFYCGVGLRSWEKEDDPWVMHVRWRSSCDYVKNVKGEDFVIQALAGNPSGSTATPSSPSSDRPDTSNTNSDVVRSALEMGFDRDLINRVMGELSNGAIQLDTLLEHLLTATPQPGAEDSTGSQSEVTTFYSRPEHTSTSGNSIEATPQVLPPAVPQTNANGQQKQKDDSEKNIVLSPDEERQLEEENQSLREESTCKICMDNPSCIVFLPCGHLVTCAECAPALRRCPICRALIRGSVRVHTVTRQTQQ